MKVTVCQLDNRENQLDSMLTSLQSHIAAEKSEFLLLPEMCFGDWLAADPDPDPNRWQLAVEAHQLHIDQLDQLGVAAAIGTRPIVNQTGSFRNQAYLWTAENDTRAIHEKFYLPNEHEYWEANWYQRGPRRFDTCHLDGITFGVQICTEMWFFEWARQFAAAGAEILCIPRATPHESVDKWLAGGQSAAVCAGAYCLSSNLWIPGGSKAKGWGLGWIISPEGDVLATTSEDDPFVSVTIDLELARRSKQTYPRYVSE